MPVSHALSLQAIALNRFGLGASPGAAPDNPRGWLLDQFDHFEVRPAGFAALPDAGAMVTAYQAERRMERKNQPPPAASGATTDGAGVKDPVLLAARQDYGQQVQALYRAAVQARSDAALQTQAPFVERMVHFWSNHFCVSVDNQPVTAYAGSFERDAIRPYVLGRFEDMAMAVEHHPAMLIYLNQNQSIGPNSIAAQRSALGGDPAKRRGLNENLAREIMELHTLGVRSGYTQADVTEFARALTGWSVSGAESNTPGTFLFRDRQHEPGSRQILGRSYHQVGEHQARAALGDFTHAPATATHIATKLARHFAGDTPPPAMVARLAAAFTSGRGDLPTLYKALIDSPEAWAPQPLKFKTPWEWTISALRGLGRGETGAIQMAAVQRQLGQPVWKPGSPAGWDDLGASWIAPDALMRRVEFAQRLAAPLGAQIDARALAPRLLPASLDPATAGQVAMAESPVSALALLLVSPDFLRR
ncbi:DUF1800 domain-containing protein [Novosphingobium sp.]|uniref:DUF1800 domain-containing protein n=1 Tax=Novosphingobium sp. TaxID=1874826 RepID=UPI0031D324E0